MGFWFWPGGRGHGTNYFQLSRILARAVIELRGLSRRMTSGLIGQLISSLLLTRPYRTVRYCSVVSRRGSKGAQEPSSTVQPEPLAVVSKELRGQRQPAAAQARIVPPWTPGATSTRTLILNLDRGDAKYSPGVCPVKI